MKKNGQVYTPYSCIAFDITAEETAATDIEHIVALAEAHDSGIADNRRRDIASDLDNLTIADPMVNRSEKSDRDAAEWMPDRHGAWFAQRVISVKREYELSVDPAERDALDMLLAGGEAELNCVGADSVPGALEFAHFANGSAITSDLVLVNLAPHPIRPELYFYDREGDRIAAESVVEVTGELEVAEDGSLTIQGEMGPLQEVTISTHGQGEVVAGSVTVLSNGPIGGVLRFDLPGVGVAGVGAGQAVRDALFPARRQEGGISTAAAIRNLQEEELVVTCQLMQEGTVLEEVEIELQAKGQDGRFIEEVFTTTDTSDFVGMVRCRAEGEFTGVAVELDAGNRIFTTLPVLPVDRMVGRSGEYSLEFAHFANGASITSDLVLVNVSTQPSRPASPFTTPIPPTRPSFYFYDREGERLAAQSVVEIAGNLEVAEDGGLTIQNELKPLQAVTISTHGQGVVVAGSMRVVADGPIGGVLRFDLPGVGVAGVGAGQAVRDALFPARRKEGGISTAAAIRNLEEKELVVSCRLMQEGAVLEEVDIDLKAKGQDGRFIEEVFTRTDTSDFVGLVRCTADGEFTGVAVELDAANRIFTTLPVVPVVQPGFTLSGTVSDGRRNGPLLAGAVVRFENGQRESTTTGPDSRYRFPNVSGTVTVTAAAEPSYAAATVEVTMDADRTVDFTLEHTGIPPYAGTVFITPDVLGPSDPTSLRGVTYAGRGQREIYDRRLGRRITVNAYLFTARYAGQELEFQVNPEFGSREAARAEVDTYAPALGRLPAVLLSRAREVEINAGKELFGGNGFNGSFLIHTDQGREYIRNGFLEEAFLHEAAHVSLDLTHANSAGWRSAQEADGVFISDYARDFPDREDIAESILPYFAVRSRPEWLSESDRSAILATIPNRLVYFDEQGFDMSP